MACPLTWIDSIDMAGGILWVQHDVFGLADCPSLLACFNP